jgi:SAM-dependent methyltransferase
LPFPAFDLVIGGAPRFAAEAPWAWRLVRRLATALPACRVVEVPGRRPVVADAAGEAPLVLVQADPEAYLAPAAARRLLETAGRDGADLAIPGTNEPWSEPARSAPPFAYQTPSLLERAAELAARSSEPPVPAPQARSPVFAVRRRVLAELPPDLPLDEVPPAAAGAGRSFVDRGAYLHRYADMDRQEREDLVERLPRGARSVLDVGCSRGATGRRLRDWGVLRVVGIEPHAGNASGAAEVCDRVLSARLEEVTEEFPGQFDGILFGDVLEHLADPSSALVRVRPWLSPAGVVVASVPNLGHWSIVADLLEGRFDYVPYSILSGTHLRFFTRATVTDLFEACGYRLDSIETVDAPPPPIVRSAFDRLAAFPGASADLEAAEFLVVARPDSNL